MTYLVRTRTGEGCLLILGVVYTPSSSRYRRSIQVWYTLRDATRRSQRVYSSGRRGQHDDVVRMYAFKRKEGCQ